MSLEPKAASTKIPIVAIQKIGMGQDGNNKCNDSTVAQQLINKNATKATVAKILKNLFWFMKFDLVAEIKIYYYLQINL